MLNRQLESKEQELWATTASLGLSVQITRRTGVPILTQMILTRMVLLQFRARLCCWRRQSHVSFT